MNERKIKIGIFGLNRGMANAKAIKLCGGDIIAVCDKNDERRRAFKERIEPKCTVFDDFDSLIKCGIEAVYIANYFPEHAPYAIKALEKGIHVISECTSNGTMAEGVALMRAAEKSSAIYMLGENYPYMLFNLEMQRVYQEGSLGKILFGEGEYNHASPSTDPNAVRSLYDSETHWRNYLPATYYLTHSLAPLMCATHSVPKRVCALPVFSPKEGDDIITASRNGDALAIMTVLNDDGSVFRITGHSTFGYSENSYRLACKKGQIENVRGTDGKVMLSYNSWHTPAGAKESDLYYPHENENDAPLAAQTGHFGSDYYMFKDFFDCIRTNRRPYLDAFVATTMASVGILGHRSLLKLGEPMDIPDLRLEQERKKYENDTLSPFYAYDGKVSPSVQVCSDDSFSPSDDKIQRFKKAISKN